MRSTSKARARVIIGSDVLPSTGGSRFPAYQAAETTCQL